MTSIDHLPNGSFLPLGVGPAGYAIWHVIRALLDLERQDNTPHRLVKRAEYMLSSASYLTLAIAATVRTAARVTGLARLDHSVAEFSVLAVIFEYAYLKNVLHFFCTRCETVRNDMTRGFRESA